MDGLSACQRLRERGVQVPVLVLSARTDMPDRVIALEIGADDYLGKPYAALEVHARIKALLRRAALEASRPRRPGVADAHRTDAVAIGNRVFSNAECTLTANGRRLKMTWRECALLNELATNLDLPVPRERLHRVIERPGAVCSIRAVDAMILKLRRLIEADAENPRHLRTVRGSGYVLLSDAASD